VALIAVSRVAMGANNVLNRTMLLVHVPDHFRGRVFSTVETMMHATMMLSLTVASVATDYYSARAIAFAAGCCSSATAFFWAWANAAGKLPEPAPQPVDEEPVYKAPVTPA
jgi:MFS family permease